MDSHILNSLVLISFVFFVVVTLKIGSNLKKTKPTPNIPPGPRKLPIVGNILHLFTSTPHQKLRNLAKIYGPLMHLQLGEIFTIVVSSPEYAQEVMKTHDLVFASRHHTLASKVISYDSKDIAFAPYGNYWRQLRKICMMEILSQKRVNSFSPIRDEILTNLIKEIDSQKGSPFNLTQAVISAMYTIISRASFGKICKCPEEFISVLKEIIKLAGGFHVGDLFPSAKWFPLVTGFGPKLHKLQQQNDQILESIVIEHKEAKSKAKEGHDTTEEDLVDVLLKFQDSTQDFCLTNNNIKAIILDMLSGGSETAATTINWAMAEMIRDPRVMKKAQFEVREIFKTKGRVDETCINELKYVKLVVKETLRLHPPIPFLIPRECGQACDIRGYHIPAKSRVIVNAWAIGRDPNYWTEAERFYPERFIDSTVDHRGTNFEYIPFGAGRRMCPGITFGLINVELTLAFLLYHFDWKLPNKMKVEDLDMTEEFGIAIKRKDDLYLIPMASPLVAI